MKPNIDGGRISGVSPISPAGYQTAVPGVILCFWYDIAAGANADYDITPTFPIRVIDSWLQLQGAGVASSVTTVKNAANAISSAMAASGSDQAVVRSASLDDARCDIAAGGTLRVSTSGGASAPAQRVYVEAIRIG